uniref:SWIM-type domain-containing protein n=1 Tax=Panagrolaimus sp. PS1159 TaxID=55785 RepID=A0AC35F720_9BILA
MEKSYDTFNRKKDHCKVNLNLNQNQKCFDPSSVLSVSKSNNKQHCVSDSFEVNEKSKAYNNASMSSQYTNTFESSNFNTLSFINKKEELDDKWKKKASPNTTNGSTLSLHISAYKNSLVAGASDFLGNKTFKKKNEKFNWCKKGRNNILVGLNPAIQIPYEFPRQQKGNEEVNPEIMQFKWSQQLLNPNESTAQMHNQNITNHRPIQTCFRQAKPFYRSDSSSSEEEERHETTSNKSLSQNSLDASFATDKEVKRSRENESYGDHYFGTGKQLDDTLISDEYETSPDITVFPTSSDVFNNPTPTTQVLHLDKSQFSSATSSQNQNNNDVIFVEEIQNPRPSSLENGCPPASPKCPMDIMVYEEDDEIAFVKVDEINTTQLLKQVYGYDNSHENYVIQNMAPDFPPNKKGIFVCIVDANFVEYVADMRNDKLGPWNNSEVHYNIDKIGLYKRGNNYEAITRKVKGAENVARLCRMTHPNPEFKVKKRVYWAFNSTHKDVPVADTFIVIVYDVEEVFILTDEQKQKHRRLTKAASTKLDQIIIGKTGKEANLKFYENGGMINNDKYNLANLTQIRNKMSYSKQWEPKTKKGRPRNEDMEEMRRLLSEHFIIRSHYVGGDNTEERYFLSTPAHMHFFKNVLPKKKLVQKFFDLAEELLKYPENERMQKAKELIESKFYKEYQESGICFLDVTFCLSRDFYVSMLLCSCQHIRNTKGDPFVFIPAVLLSRTHRSSDFEWFGSELEKQTGTDVCARAYMTDAEKSLLHLQDRCVLFKPPCIKLNCNIHSKETFKAYCNDNSNIMREVFGIDNGEIHITGLIDELEYEKFYDNITALATTDNWNQYPQLQSFVSSEARLKHFFETHSLKSRLVGGFGFKQATDNVGECQNMLVKSKSRFKDNMPINDLIKEFQKLMVEQLADIARVFVHKDPCQLYDPTRFLGDLKWATLSEEKIRELLKGIFIINSDLLPGFETQKTSFPAILAQNTSEEQRNNMALVARTYKVIEDEPGSFIVKKGDDLKNINTNNSTIICKCRMANQKQVICHHMLAVHLKFPSSNILKKLELSLEKETVIERNKRFNDPTGGAMQGQSRRRRGNAKSRNGFYEKVTNYLNIDNDFPPKMLSTKRKAVELDSRMRKAISSNVQEPPLKKKKVFSTSNDSEIILLDDNSESQNNRLPQVPVSKRNSGVVPVSSNTDIPLTRIVPQRVIMPRSLATNIIPVKHPAKLTPLNTLAETSLSKVKEIIDNYYRNHPESPLPDHLSYNPFTITTVSKLSGWNNRRCAQCNTLLGDKADNIVVSHVEPYTYQQNGIPTKTIGARAICPSLLCMNRRYPFISKQCFISELTFAETESILKDILR